MTCGKISSYFFLALKSIGAIFHLKGKPINSKIIMINLKNTMLNKGNHFIGNYFGFCRKSPFWFIAVILHTAYENMIQ